MAVVMLTEGCRCNQDYLFDHLVNRMQSNDRSCGCFVGEDVPLLSGWFDRFTNWVGETISNTCPACHRVVDNAGDFIVNLSNMGAQVPQQLNYLTGQTINAAGQIIQGTGQGVGGFLQNPQNIPCAAGMVGAAFGMPAGFGGCMPQGFNEQQFFQQQSNVLQNPLLLYGLGAVALILLLK